MGSRLKKTNGDVEVSGKQNRRSSRTKKLTYRQVEEEVVRKNNVHKRKPTEDLGGKDNKIKKILEVKKEYSVRVRNNNRGMNVNEEEDEIEILGESRNKEKKISAYLESNNAEDSRKEGMKRTIPKGMLVKTIFADEEDDEVGGEGSGDESGKTDGSSDRSAVQRQLDITKEQGSSSSDGRMVTIPKSVLDNMTKTICTSVNKSVSWVLDRKIGALEKEKEEYVNIIHSLVGICEGNKKGTIARHKVQGMKSILSTKLYRTLFTKFLFLELHRCLGSVDEWMLGDDEERDVSKVCKLLRTLMHSSKKGGKKDKIHEDVDILGTEQKELRIKLTWVMLYYIQRNEDVGQLTINVNGGVRKVEKPMWLRAGYITRKMVSEHVKHRKGKRKKNDDEETEEKQQLLEEVMLFFNDTHNKYFNRVRERIREDLMKEFGFLFEDMLNINVVSNLTLDINRMTEIPEMKLENLGSSDKEEAIRSLWMKGKEIVEDTMTIVVSYKVNVYEDEEDRSKADGNCKFGNVILKRELDFMNVGLSFMLKLTCCTTIYEYFGSNRNSMKLVYGIGRMFMFMFRHLKEKEERHIDSENTLLIFEIESMLDSILPQQLSTRTSICQKEVLNITSSMFDELRNERGGEIQKELCTRDEDVDKNDILAEYDESILDM